MLPKLISIIACVFPAEIVDRPYGLTADNGMDAIGPRNYIAVTGISAVVIPGSNNGKYIRAGIEYGRCVVLRSIESSNGGLLLVIVVQHETLQLSKRATETIIAASRGQANKSSYGAQECWGRPTKPRGAFRRILV